MSVELTAPLPATLATFPIPLADDKHQDNGPRPQQDYRDVTQSIAVKTPSAWRRVALAPGRQPRRAGCQEGTTGLPVPYIRHQSRRAGAQFHGGAEAFASVAHKTRLPLTIKDRYSASSVAACPNPDLCRARALNVEGKAGLRGSPWAARRGQVTRFYSRIEDLMQRVNILPVSLCKQPSATADSCAPSCRTSPRPVTPGSSCPPGALPAGCWVATTIYLDRKPQSTPAAHIAA